MAASHSLRPYSLRQQLRSTAQCAFMFHPPRGSPLRAARGGPGVVDAHLLAGRGAPSVASATAATPASTYHVSIIAAPPFDVMAAQTRQQLCSLAVERAAPRFGHRLPGTRLPLMPASTAASTVGALQGPALKPFTEVAGQTRVIHIKCEDYMHDVVLPHCGVRILHRMVQ